MGGALLRRWVENKQHRFIVADPAKPDVPDGVRCVQSADELEAGHADFLIVALKPQLIEKVLPDYMSCLSEDGALVSIAAGYAMSRLETQSGSGAVIRVMPNLPAMIGQGVSGLFANQAATAAQRGVVEGLMSLSGVGLWVDSEDMLDRLTAVAGSGPGYMFEFARTYVEAAKGLGFTAEQAEKLVLGTMSGTIALASESELSLAKQRDNVTSKGGTTAAGLQKLNGEGDLTRLITKTLEAAYARAVELR